VGLFSFLTQEIAIDLGTANTLIIMNDKVVVDEPSIVAKDIQTGKVVAIGKKAQQMHGKTHKLTRQNMLEQKKCILFMNQWPLQSVSVLMSRNQWAT